MLTVTKHKTFGAPKLTTFDVAFDASYAAGGEDLSAALDGVEGKVVDAWAQPIDGYTFSIDLASKKVKAFWVDTTVDGAAEAEVADTTDLSAVTTRVTVLSYISA